MSDIYDHSVTLIGGQTVSMRDYAGKVLLIVNTASACGFTPQYEGLEQLQKDYAARGFSVLAFPCNQFGGQEPGSSEEIASFCETKYHTTFPLFAKVDVNGSEAHPLFKLLKSESSGWLGPAIKWNFTKFLVDRTGKVVERFAPTTAPSSIARKIEELL